MSIRFNKTCLFCKNTWDEMNNGRDPYVLVELQIDSICSSCLSKLQNLFKLNEDGSLKEDIAYIKEVKKDVEHIKEIIQPVNKDIGGDIIL